MQEILWYNGGLFIQPHIPPPPPEYSQYQESYNQYRGRTYRAPLPDVEVWIKNPQSPMFYTSAIKNTESEQELYREYTRTSVDEYVWEAQKDMFLEDWETPIFSHIDDYRFTYLPEWGNVTEEYQQRVWSKRRNQYDLNQSTQGETSGPMFSSRRSIRRSEEGYFGNSTFEPRWNYTYRNPSEVNKFEERENITLTEQLSLKIAYLTQIAENATMNGAPDIMVEEWIHQLKMEQKELQIEEDEENDEYGILDTANGQSRLLFGADASPNLFSNTTFNTTQSFEDYVVNSYFGRKFNMTVEKLRLLGKVDDGDEAEYSDPEELLTLPDDAFTSDLHITELEAAEKRLFATVRTVIFGRNPLGENATGFPILPVIEKIYGHIQNATKETINPKRIRYTIEAITTERKRGNLASKIHNEYGKQKFLQDHVSKYYN
jgi:hypothetical protein